MEEYQEELEKAVNLLDNINEGVDDNSRYLREVVDSAEKQEKLLESILEQMKIQTNILEQMHRNTRY